MAYLLLFKYMFNCNETKDIIEKEYNIIKKIKKLILIYLVANKY